MDALLSPAFRWRRCSYSGCRRRSENSTPDSDQIVLLSAPEYVILERIANRTTNDFGKTDAERALVLHHLRTVEPLLRAGATAEIDTRRPVNDVAARPRGMTESEGAR